MCAKCDYSDYILKIDQILDVGRAPGNTVEFLESVRSQAEEREHITDSQKEAVDRIAERHDVG